jgi:hypothetical protein
MQRRPGILIFFTALLLIPSLACALTKEVEHPGELVAPSSPAFQILGQTPNVVNRPESPREFLAAIMQNVQENNNSFPSDFAVEFTPYWWFPHDDLDAATYLGIHNNEQVFDTLLRTLSVSFATTQKRRSIKGQTYEGSAIGFGVRFNLLNGQNDRETLDQLLEAMFLAAPDDINGTFEPDTGLTGALTAKLRKSYGWKVQMAFAGSYFDADDTSQSRFDKVGAWVTTSYTDKNATSLEYIMNLRYTHDEAIADYKDAYDIGASLSWKSTVAPVTASAEFVQRFVKEKSPHHLAATLEYKLNDDYAIIASYGQTFSYANPERTELSARFGLNLGFGQMTDTIKYGMR